MSYELLRYGDGHEMHVVARLDPAGELLGILSVKQQCVNIYAEERVYELLVKDLGLELPRLTMNDIDNSYGTAAERKYIPGAEEVVTNYAFADPHNLPTRCSLGSSTRSTTR